MSALGIEQLKKLPNLIGGVARMVLDFKVSANHPFFQSNARLESQAGSVFLVLRKEANIRRSDFGAKAYNACLNAAR